MINNPARELREILDLLREVLYVEKENRHLLRRLLGYRVFPTSIAFNQQGDAMLPVEAGNTLVYTGTLSPAGAVFPSGATFTVTSNDPAITPTVDATGLIVTVPLPTGWVESTTTPLAVSYQANGTTEVPGSISETITPGAEVQGFPTGITFQQTT